MFENSNAAHPSKLQNAKSAPSLNRRSLPNSSGLAGTVDAPGMAGAKTGSSQHLKNALNLGKAMGARVNDLLRRKDPSSLGDIGVTEVNKNVGAVWACMEGATQGVTANSHTFDAFPRLDPPPPTNKKRLPRALKTTQDMMISSDPVVATPEVPDSSYASSPDKTPLIQEDKSKEQLNEEEADERELEKDSGQTSAIYCEVKEEVEGITKPDAVGLDGPKENHEEDLSQLLLSVPDLIHKDNLDPRQKPGGLETRMASTPVKSDIRVSVGEDDLLDNGSVVLGVPRQRSSSVDNEEPHPDLLSFE
ncbi:uncharacterized protein C1orf226 homolog [Megalops cyprinoides]|uniref:uncharacterized protein C1orf226 homolog n=1 Tax=Megalops cyprinoides TaxID=118141 RepID=UPI001863CDB1|nr:uncharacterized protein C1orf226 homolog [Megalops cyprinoides]